MYLFILSFRVTPPIMLFCFLLLSLVEFSYSKVSL